MMTALFLPPRTTARTTKMVRACANLLRAAIITPLLMIVACTQAPTVPIEDPAVLHPKATPVPVVVAQPPVTTAQPLAKEAVSAMPAVPPADGNATSVAAASGSVAPARAQPSAAQIATMASLTPPGKTRYDCVKGESGSEVRQPITFPESSGRICARFPAMGPCQYERVACRASGGRVIRFDGIEITKEVEGEYDKQVQRFTLNAG